MIVLASFFGIDILVAALIAASVASVGGAALGVANAADARSDARRGERRQKREQADAEKRAAERAAADEQATLASIKRSRYSVGRGVSRGGTIATSPIGVVGGSGASTGGGQKTILGA
jgi:hypothetical protein